MSGRGDRVDVAAFNLGEAPRRVAIDLARCGLAAPDADLPEFWTGRTVSLRGGIVAMGKKQPWRELA